MRSVFITYKMKKWRSKCWYSQFSQCMHRQAEFTWLKSRHMLFGQTHFHTNIVTHDSEGHLRMFSWLLNPLLNSSDRCWDEMSCNLYKQRVWLFFFFFTCKQHMIELIWHRSIDIIYYQSIIGWWITLSIYVNPEKIFMYIMEKVFSLHKQQLKTTQI